MRNDVHVFPFVHSYVVTMKTEVSTSVTMPSDFWLFSIEFAPHSLDTLRDNFMRSNSERPML